MRLFFSALTAIARASIRPPVLPLGCLFGFGVAIPLRHGFDFLDVRMILAYAFIPMLFIASPVALGLAQARQSYRILLTWIAAATLYGWFIGLFVLAAALTTLNALARLAVANAPLQLPPAATLGTYALFCFSAVWFIAASAAYLGLLFTPNWARQLLRAGFAVLLAAFYIGPTALPPAMQYELIRINHNGLARRAAAIFLLAAIGTSWALHAIDGQPVPDKRIR